MAQKGTIYSKIVLWLCFAAMAWGSFIYYPRWEKPGSESTIAWDVEGYYWYLPSVFIYKDLKKQAFREDIMQKYKASPADGFLHGFVHEQSGNMVLKYTSGMALLYSPAFFTGHAAAKLFGYEADGFSTPYKLSLQVWGLLFSFLGLFYLRKLLLIFYSDTVTAIVLFLLVFGTNYFNYAAIDVGMSHTWLFTLYVFIILNTHFFYQTDKKKYLYRVGFLIGLATLIRPTEIIAGLIPMLWGLENIRGLKERLRFFVARRNAVDIAACCAFAVIAIQLLYWKYVSGEWIVYSYENQGFNFTKPHIADFSWSYRAGWLRYCPMMFLAFVGLVPFLSRGKNKLAVVSFFLLNFYIVCAWNIWDYGGFSGRAMIQSYPILMFPVAALIQVALQKKWLGFLLAPFLLLFLYLNIWFTIQAHRDGLLDAMGTTRAYYWQIVGRWGLPDAGYLKLKDTDELFKGAPKNKTVVYEDPISDTLHSCISAVKHATDAIVLPASIASKKWLRAEADFEGFAKEYDTWSMPQLVIKFMRKEEEYKVRFIRVGRFLGDHETKRLYMDMKVPDVACDSIKISLYNGEGSEKCCMRQLTVSVFDE